MNKSYITSVIKKWKITGAIMALLVFMFLIFGPVEIFYANFSDFDFELKDFLGLFVCTGLVIWLISSIIISLFPNKINRIINTFLLAVSVSCYIQNMFFNTKLMGTVGNAMDWNELKTYTIINTVIWIIMMAGIVVALNIFSKYSDKICLYVSIFLLLIQGVAFVSVIIPLMGDDYKTSHYKFSSAEEFEFAKDENVIILLLDATSERFFQEQIKESPEILDGLEDFTYYTNYEPCYMTTCPAVTYMWTGVTPDCTVKRQTWQKNAWTDKETNSYFERIHNKGYQCRFFVNNQRVLFGDIGDTIDKVDNVVFMNAKVNKKMMFDLLEKYTVYRYVPYIIKPRFEVNLEHFRGVAIYDEDNDHKEAMIDFYERIQNNKISVNENLSKLVYYHHFDGIHGPWSIDENGNRVPDSDESITAERVVRGDFVAIRYFLNQLKELGIYDNATIIISADHGNVFDHTDLQCIFFLKNKGEKHNAIQFNDAPISVDDFRASLLKFIGDENYSNIGTTYFDWKSGDSRDRYSMVRDLGGEDGFNGYLYNGDGEVLYETIMDGYDTKIVNTGGWR